MYAACIFQRLLIAFPMTLLKIKVYGVSNGALDLIQSYLAIGKGVGRFQ